MAAGYRPHYAGGAAVFQAQYLVVGSGAGLAAETDAALALAGKQIRAVGMATETDTALTNTFGSGSVKPPAALLHLLTGGYA